MRTGYLNIQYNIHIFLQVLNISMYKNQLLIMFKQINVNCMHCYIIASLIKDRILDGAINIP